MVAGTALTVCSFETFERKGNRADHTRARAMHTHTQTHAHSRTSTLSRETARCILFEAKRTEINANYQREGAQLEPAVHKQSLARLRRVDARGTSACLSLRIDPADTRDSAEWRLEGDGCSPECKHHSITAQTFARFCLIFSSCFPLKHWRGAGGWSAVKLALRIADSEASRVAATSLNHNAPHVPATSGGIAASKNRRQCNSAVC